MKKAVIITENQYPCEDAGAIRQHATAKILEALGYSVFVVGYGKPTDKKVLNYDGVEYISFRPNSKNKLVRMVYRATASRRMMRFVKRNCKDVSLMLVTDTADKTLKRAFEYTRNKEVVLIHDSVEWFSGEQYAKGEKARAYKVRDNINRNIVGKGWRVVAISEYLEKHFASTADRAVRIPVIMDISSIESNSQPTPEGERIKLAYVGAPGRKDYLKNIIEGASQLPAKALEKIELHIVGASRQQLVSVCGVDEKKIEALGSALNIHGRVPHAEAIRFVREADYTLLFRDASLRYAKAGFPTKIVESLASGTPPVCNLSSDLGLYLKDGENAFLAADHSPESVRDALERAINTPFEHRKQMRENARNTAKECFDYSKYIELFEELIRD